MTLDMSVGKGLMQFPVHVRERFQHTELQNNEACYIH